MSISKQFLEYYRTEFFPENPEEFAEFEKSLLRPLPKTIRINTLRPHAMEFMRLHEAHGWRFEPTPNARAFRVHREDTSRALGSTLEHLLGDFYIQELSASMSVWHLVGESSDAIENPYLILDMASSPGGKTTQLAEHFPNSFIIANEFGKERLSALIENVERMGHMERTGIVNSNGVEYAYPSETFDRVLLDAPCSGEGIGFKAESSLKFWNVKNVKTIARLQMKLLKAGLAALKVGGELLYSTCTLNRFENEEVLEEALTAFPGTFEIVFQKRFWPHKEEAGGFFVARLRKTASLPITERAAEKALRKASANEELSVCSPTEERMIRASLETLGANDFLENGRYVFFKYKSDILAVRNFPGIKEIAKSRYFIRFWERIGRLEYYGLEPNWILGKNRILSGVARYTIADEKALDAYLKGSEIHVENTLSENSSLENPSSEIIFSGNVSSEIIFSGASASRCPFEKISEDTAHSKKTQKDSAWSTSAIPVQIFFMGRPVGLEYFKNNTISNRFPKEWRRR